MTIFLLYGETSDQMGTNEVIGAYTTEEAAQKAMAQVRYVRSFIQPWEADQPPAWYYPHRHSRQRP
jgi:hypothetical protein